MAHYTVQTIVDCSLLSHVTDSIRVLLAPCVAYAYCICTQL